MSSVETSNFRCGTNRVPSEVLLAPSKSMQKEPADFTGPPGVRKKLSATNCGPFGVTGTGWLEKEEWGKRSQTQTGILWRCLKAGLGECGTRGSPAWLWNRLGESGWVLHAQVLFVKARKKAHGNSVARTARTLSQVWRGGRPSLSSLSHPFSLQRRKAKASLPWHWHLRLNNPRKKVN